LISRDDIPKKNVTPPRRRDNMSSKTPDLSQNKSVSNNTISGDLHLSQSAFEKQRIELADARQEILTLCNRTSTIDRIRSVLSTVSPDAIIATDRNLDIVEWNEEAESLFGLKATAAEGQTISLEVHSQIVEALKAKIVFDGLASQGYWIGNLPVVNREKHVLSTRVSVGVLWDQAGDFNGLVAIYHLTSDNPVKDTTTIDHDLEKKVKQRTEELEKANRVLQQELAVHKQTALLARESEGKNRDLVDNIKLGIFRCTPGPKGKFIEVNRAMEDITGYSRDELLQIDVCKIWTNAEEGAPYTNEVNISDWKVTRELQLTRKDGLKILVGDTVVAIRFDSGIIQYFDGILEDITERKHAQMQVQQSLQQLQKTIKEIIEAMAYIGEVRDPYTAGHQRRVAQLSFDIARSMGLQDELFEGLTMAAFVHDIGKILVPSDILSKPGKLTKPEFDMLRDHTRVGYEILKTIEFPWPIAKIVLQHHERMNGSGYPSGLIGDQIIIEARILAVADVVEAMSSHRPYRPALGIEKALEEINLNRGKLYDPKVVDACVKLFNDKAYSLN
jgi:PAS domain S-box-containing protein/putative nucleotidyltransferase with HDIG domain